jgi:hypothetical protein
MSETVMFSLCEPTKVPVTRPMMALVKPAITQLSRAEGEARGSRTQPS